MIPVCSSAEETLIFEIDQSTPRRWAYVSDVINAFENNAVASDNTLAVTVAGLVGDVHCAAFLRSYSQSEEPLPATSVIHDYRRYRREVTKWCKTKRTDLLNRTAIAVRKGQQQAA